MNNFEQTTYQALLQVCSHNHRKCIPYVEQLRALIYQTELHVPDVAAGMREHAVYAEWQQAYNDPETSKDLEKLTELVFEVHMKLLGYKQYLILGQRGWNIRVKYTGVSGMEWATITLENLAKGKERPPAYKGHMSSLLALSYAFKLQNDLSGDFEYWAGE